MGLLASKTILVTGGGGFLGGAIVRRLCERGERVRTFSRGFYPELEKQGVEQIQGDIADPEAVENACRDVELVFHTAARPGVGVKADPFFRTNVTGTENVLRACRSQCVERLIYTSSPSVIFDGTSMEGVDETAAYPAEFHAHYPRTKALAEQAVLLAARNGVKAVCLRPHLIWGPGDNHLVPRILERAEKLKVVGNSENLVDTIYIDNAAHAHLLAAEKLLERPELSGRIYFISQDEPIPLWKMVNAILEAGGKPPVRGSVSPSVAYAAGTVLEGVYRLLGLEGEPRMTRFVARELATSHWFNISAAKRDLGYQPLVSTQEGLRRLKQWLEKEPYASTRS